MDARLEILLQQHEIREVLARYCRGCDRCDEVDMAAVYATDSWDDHGHRSGEGRKFAAATVRELLQTTRIVSHLLGQSLIWVDGDEASAETYFYATMLAKITEQDGQRLHHISGRYVDQLVRQSSRWLIKKRLTIRDWSITHRIDEDQLQEAGLAQARPGAEDPSYVALGQRFNGQLFRTS